MKLCLNCQMFFGEQVMRCQHCTGALVEVNLSEAIQLTGSQSLRERIGGKSQHLLSDGYKQYHIRQYIGDRSLFLDYDLDKNRLKHGRRLKRFLISPVNAFSFFNLPWLLFNVVSSNLFHMHYTEYCPRCDSKYIKGNHTAEECDYNIEYFHVLDDILNGAFVERKKIYERYALHQQTLHKRSAYYELFHRPIRWEAFWDITSILFSLLFWLYLFVYISYPTVKAVLLDIQNTERIELL